MTAPREDSLFDAPPPDVAPAAGGGTPAAAAPSAAEEAALRAGPLPSADELMPEHPEDLIEREGEGPLAKLYGEPLEKCPQGLYIPPDALRVFLERFEGPLDLLLWLIRSQKFDVMDVPMAALTEQYMVYVELIRRTNLPLAAAYLVMAATLMSIKSRMLLPAPPAEGEEEPEDPRAELIRRLQAYALVQKQAKRLDALPRLGRDFAWADGAEGPEQISADPEVTPEDLGEAWLDVVADLKLSERHKIVRQEISVREHMTKVLKRLAGRAFLTFESLLTKESGREDVAVWCMAILELAKDRLVQLTQAAPYAPIYVTPVKDDPFAGLFDGEALFAAEGALHGEGVVKDDLAAFLAGSDVGSPQGELFAPNGAEEDEPPAEDGGSQDASGVPSEPRIPTLLGV